MAETVVKPSTKLILAQYIIAAILALAVAAYALSIAQPYYHVFLLVPALLAISAIKDHLRVAFMIITISDGKLRYQEGMLSRSTRTIELAKLQDVRVTQSFFQRLAGIGDLSLETSAESGPLSMRGVDDPQAVADRILNTGRKQ